MSSFASCKVEAAAMMMKVVPSALLLLRLLGAATVDPAAAEPLSAPYVCYRTDPYNTPPQSPSSYYHSSGIFGDNIQNATLDGRRGPYPGAKRGSRGRAKVRPIEVSPASADERRAATDGATDGAASSGRARVGGEGDPRCPLAFRLGLTHKSSSSSAGGTGSASGINGPVLTYPAHPARGPGRQVVFLENWERVDMLTPSHVTRREARRGGEEAMEMDEQFPLLFEGSNFYHSVPILHDENGDGVMDITMIDYDGGVYTVGLDYNPDDSGNNNNNNKERYVKAAQVPRLYIRKDWVESATNLTKMEEYVNPPAEEDHEDEDGNPRDYHYRGYRSENPPFHSYFEYGLEWKEDHDNKRIGASGGAVSADVLSQSVEDVQKIDDERVRRWKEAQEEILSKKKQKEEAEAAAAAAGTDAESGVSTNTQHELGGVPEFEDGGGDAVRGDRRRLEEIPPAAEEVDAGTSTVDSNADAAVSTSSEQVEENRQAEAKDQSAETPGRTEVENEGGDNKMTEAATETASTGENVDIAKDDQDAPEVIDAIPVEKKKKKKKKVKEPKPAVVPDKKVEGEPCGDCYGAAKEEDDCCNSCAQVVAAYKAKHWGVKKADIAQCVEEGDLDDSKPDEPSHTHDDDEYYGEDRPDDDVAGPRGYGDDDGSMAAAPYEGGDDDYRRHGYGK